MLLEEKIQDLFVTCSGANGSVDFKSVCKALWVSFNNGVSLVDTAGVFTVSIPGNGLEVLNSELFTEFIKAFARLRYPIHQDFCNLVLDELKKSKGLKVNTDSTFFANALDKNVIRILLKFDLPLRRAFSNFCGQSVRVGGVLTWDEVKNLSIGMEIDGFMAFAGASSLVPEHLSTQQCELLFREVLTKYPLSANTFHQKTDILFPQFQLLLLMVAIERNENLSKKEKISESGYAKKEVDIRNRPLVDSLLELFREIGISKQTEQIEVANPNIYTIDNTNQVLMEMKNRIMRSSGGGRRGGGDGGGHEHNLFTGTVIAPSSHKPQSLHSSSLQHSRQAMMLRMEYLFDEVETRVMEITPPESEVILMISTNPKDDVDDNKVKLSSKPVVIADALPVPSQCPDSVEQLLEASLAHHNLGSYEESLKFLEAARIQLKDIHQRYEEYEKIHGLQNPESKLMFLDLEMYIMLCKGNVYQSCGDDEQSLLNYMDGWSTAKTNQDKDWEIICLNSIGMLAYYNLRYDVALLCFHIVVHFRNENYGEENADTATAFNNEACCLYCMDKRAESRLRFEKSWTTICKCLGHRSPRAVAVWKNLEKARRAHAPLKSASDKKDSLEMRPDIDRLLLGGNFNIQCEAPDGGAGGGKKKKGKKGGGKKKKK